MHSLDGLDGILEGLCSVELALLADSLSGGLVLGEAATDGAGLLLAQVDGQEFLASKLSLGLSAVHLRDDGVDAGNSLANVAT